MEFEICDNVPNKDGKGENSQVLRKGSIEKVVEVTDEEKEKIIGFYAD